MLFHCAVSFHYFRMLYSSFYEILIFILFRMRDQDYSFCKIFAESFPSCWMLCRHGTAARYDVLDARRTGSRYRFGESRKSRTVVKRGPVLACRSGGTRDVCIYVYVACHVAAMKTPMRKRESVSRQFPISDSPLRTAHVDVTFNRMWKSH